MTKIAYLFGAGASIGCLPIVREFPQSLYSQINLLKDERFRMDDGTFDVAITLTKSDLQSELLKDLEWLWNESRVHASVDTFAKKLLLRKQYNDLYRLKVALSVFFIIEQIRNPPDTRYDTFYASILNGDVTGFPRNLSIVSWNYDLQFELAYSEYTGNREKIESTCYPIVCKYSNDEANSDEFAIFKLNGSTVLRSSSGQHTFLDSFTLGPSIDSIASVIRNYAVARFMDRKFHSGLSFAWESETNEDNIVNKAIRAIVNAEILVVIGYSFPQFNREIDRQIIKSMQALKKVYIQAPDAVDIVERFEAVRGETKSLLIVPRQDIGQFLIPNEF